jgi:pimeloyl-ACP methyl ester carboxylesterase
MSQHDTGPATESVHEPRPAGSEPSAEQLAAVTASEELFATSTDGLQICFQTFGDRTGRPLLLVMGLGGPMTWWPEELCRRFAFEGYFVVRYDNRDTGRSDRYTQGHRVRRTDLVKAFVGVRSAAPYSLSDMALDGLAVLDELGIEKAHVCGVSMGGMIAQTLAIEHPDRVLSLTSVMSSTGHRLTGWQDPRLLPRLLGRSGRTREEYVEQSARFSGIIGSPGYRDPVERARERAGDTWDRGISLSGVMRQMLAILTQPDRRKALGAVTVPTTVLHGLSDRMVHHTGGRATARAIPGSHLMLVPGMGHDLPSGLWPTYVDAVNQSAQRAGQDA